MSRDAEPKKPEMTFDERIKSIKIITYAGQEIPLDRNEQEEWETLDKAKRMQKAANIRKALKLGLIKWAELGESRFLINTEKGNEANAKLEKAKKQAIAIQKERLEARAIGSFVKTEKAKAKEEGRDTTAFDELKKKRREQKLAAMRAAAKEKPKQEKVEYRLVKNSIKDNMKIRKQIKKYKYRLHKLRQYSLEAMEERNDLRNRIEKLKSWLAPRKVKIER